MQERKGEHAGPIGPNPRVVAPLPPIQFEQLIDPENAPDQDEKQQGRPQRIKQPVSIQNGWIPSRLKRLGQIPHEVKITEGLRIACFDIQHLKLDK